MPRPALRRAMLFAMGGLALSALALALYLLRPISTPPFLDARGARLPGSIAEMHTWRINGVPESVIIRGRDVANPVLIWIHGGPGQSETPVVRRFNARLEDRFTLVYWDQRYAGRSLDPLAPKPKTQSINDYVADLDVLIADLHQRLRFGKVILVAHSWGTVPGLLYVERHPENVAVYVGVGQEADTPESEKRSYDWVMAEARRRGDSQAIAELTRIGPPPRKDGDDWTPRKLLQTYGGAFHADLNFGKLFFASATQSEVNWRDALPLFIDDNEPISRQEAKIVFDKDHLHFSAPMIFVSGRYDHTVDAGLAARYLQRLSAPRKAFIWFENSAHSPPFEEPDRFNALMINMVLPLARAG